MPLPEDRLKAAKEKIAVRVARDLAFSIAEQGWPIGAAIGTEDELMRRHKVSRQPYREAVRILEWQGLARPEAKGLTVKAPALTAASNLLRTYLEFVDVSFHELYHVTYLLHRIAFEWGMARMTPAHVNSLQLHRQQMTAAFRSRDEEWRPFVNVIGVVSDAAADPCLSMLRNALTQVVGDFRQKERYPPKVWSALRDKISTVVGEIADCAVRRDTEAALAALREGFRYSEGVIRGQEKSNRRVWNTESFLSGNYSTAILSQRKAGKFGVSLAYDLIALIRRNRLAPGDKLGSENELAERFDVGRSTFREAVRAMEFLGVGEMRRGVGGGLFVVEPDPTAVIATAELYVRYFRSAQREETWEPRVRRESLTALLDAEVARLAASNITHIQLGELMAKVETLVRSGGKERAREAREIVGACLAIADNRVLALVSDVAAATEDGDIGERCDDLMLSAAQGLRAAMMQYSEEALATALARVLSGARRYVWLESAERASTVSSSAA